MPVHPPIEPYETGMLDVGDGHRLYWEMSGNPAGRPVVVLHGGPGSGSRPGWRQWFDPQVFQVVQLDQRNSGRSVPHASEPVVDLSTNTTAHLIADLERLREHVGIDRWLVLGLSWGTTLGLAYAEQHPDRVTGMVLTSVTTTTHAEVDWLTRAMGRVFPEAWERLRDGVPEGERDGNLAAAYSRLLHDAAPEVRDRAARAWCDWEDTHVATHPGHRPHRGFEDPAFRLGFARVVTHYFSHAAFLEDGALLRGAGALAGIPGVLVTGRLDISGPADTAWHLHRAWPGSELWIIEGSGHGATGEAIAAAIARFA
ncbi:prolyl aminopeptidase [Georgenia sp. EYE_87]|uniref:prolyl aminopeptidase n=1 Tax=Georgenia sp. EYE_87 TaxID=2853448 RepID=UPI002004E727|nr:prolyl aminopeptidase [Georgenia sp. EYE_87]MCK6210473.1 prolyl aminopeptidase [Georgenia sp. EYE_87]